jgi:hypothetical protein
MLETLPPLPFYPEKLQASFPRWLVNSRATIQRSFPVVLSPLDQPSAVQNSQNSSTEPCEHLSLNDFEFYVFSSCVQLRSPS